MTVDTDYDTQIKTSPEELHIKYDPNLEYNSDVQFTLETPTNNVKFPQTVYLAIHGCGKPTKSALKAQIEGDLTEGTTQPDSTGGSTQPANASVEGSTTSGAAVPGTTQPDNAPVAGSTSTGAAVPGMTQPSNAPVVGSSSLSTTSAAASTESGKNSFS